MATNNQTIFVELPHTLDKDEKLAMRDRVMEHLDTKAGLDAELVSLNAEFKRDKADVEKRQKDLDADINRVRGEIKLGVEVRKYKCNVIRDRDARRVDYVVIDGPLAGQIVKSHDFTQADWEAVLQNSEQEIPFDGVLDDDQGNPVDLRAQADLTATGPLEPNRDGNGQVVAGENTDAYNQANPDSEYQHLSEQVDFKPAVGGSVEGGSDTAPDDEEGDDDDSNEDDSDDDGDDDEPQEPTPPAPTRRATRRKPAAE